MNYEIEFNYLYQVFDNYKEKDKNILTNTISGSRLGERLSFEGYAEIVFNEEDVKHQYGHVEVLDSFDKKKTNCLIYKIKDVDRYDRIFLYYHQGHSTIYYGYVLYDTRRNKSVQIADTSGDINDIMLSLNRTFTLFPNKTNK